MSNNSTWQYLGHDEDEDIPTAWVWERLRHRRDVLLNSSDFRMVADAPWDQTVWEAYRQALRDLPEQTTDPRAAIWPEPPTD
jgi:hypothetical protein